MLIHTLDRTTYTPEDLVEREIEMKKQQRVAHAEAVQEIAALSDADLKVVAQSSGSKACCGVAFRCCLLVLLSFVAVVVFCCFLFLFSFVVSFCCFLSLPSLSLSFVFVVSRCRLSSSLLLRHFRNACPAIVPR